jgi:ADP-heptose:LPS heptosyltransferase
MFARPHSLIAHLDGAGDVLLDGPVIRALAAGSRRVTMLCGPRGAPAAALLPGLDEVIVHAAGWVEPEPPPVEREVAMSLVDRIAELGVDQALIFTSAGQSPLPLALLLRLAGVPRLGAISPDHAGSLLDIRLELDDQTEHEVARSLALADAMGCPLPACDDGRLTIERRAELPEEIAELAPYVIVHPGTSGPAVWPVEKHAQLVRLLVAWGRRVVVTGTRDQIALCAQVTGPPRPEVRGLVGDTDLATLVEVMAAADAVVSASSGAAHVAAAAGAPVVSLCETSEPPSRGRPWRVPYTMLGCDEGRGLEALEARDVLTSVQVLVSEARAAVPVS